MPIMADAASQLRDWMRESGFSQEKLGKALHARQQTISEWLSRRKVPGLRRANELEKLTGISAMDWLRVRRNQKPRVGRPERHPAA
jgi:transcriptional regulator with XRE-family HTH domain